jgi:cold-inducible RNA-binding protein
LKDLIMDNKLYVGNLAYSVRDDDLREKFSAFGQVQSAKVMMERDTGRSKGFGFVEMATAEQAQAAIAGTHGKDMGGRNLNVNVARPMEARPPRSGSGGYGGNRRDY